MWTALRPAESCQEDSHWCRPQSAASQFILCHPTSGGTTGQRVGRVDKGRECQGHHWGAPRTFQMMPEKMPWHIFSSLSVPSALVETIRCRWGGGGRHSNANSRCEQPPGFPLRSVPPHCPLHRFLHKRKFRTNQHLNCLIKE